MVTCLACTASALSHYSVSVVHSMPIVLHATLVRSAAASVTLAAHARQGLHQLFMNVCVRVRVCTFLSRDLSSFERSRMFFEQHLLYFTKIT